MFGSDNFENKSHSLFFYLGLLWQFQNFQKYTRAIYPQQPYQTCEVITRLEMIRNNDKYQLIND